MVEKKVDNNYCNTMQTSVQSNYSNTVSGIASYPLQPPVKCKNTPWVIVICLLLVTVA